MKSRLLSVLGTLLDLAITTLVGVLIAAGVWSFFDAHWGKPSVEATVSPATMANALPADPAVRGGHKVPLLRPGGSRTPWLAADGRPLRWGSCGGAIQIERSEFTATQLRSVINAASYAQRWWGGSWRIELTRRAQPAPGVIVIHRSGPRAHRAIGTTDLTLDSSGEKITSAVVWLSTDIQPGAGWWEHVTLHELAHAVGVDHSNNTANITYPAAWRPETRYTRAEAAVMRASTRCR